MALDSGDHRWQFKACLAQAMCAPIARLGLSRALRHLLSCRSACGPGGSSRDASAGWYVVWSLRYLGTVDVAGRPYLSYCRLLAKSCT